MEQSDRKYFGKSIAGTNRIVVRGSPLHSDFCGPVPFIKNKLRVIVKFKWMVLACHFPNVWRCFINKGTITADKTNTFLWQGHPFHH